MKLVFQQIKVKEEKSVFLLREWPSLVIIYLLVVVGNSESTTYLMLTMAFLGVRILTRDVSGAFCWSLFLVPNIRMFDSLGYSFLVNILMALPLIVYFFRGGIKQIPAVALGGSMVLCIMEFIHSVFLGETGNIVRLAGWTLNFVLCICVTVDPKIPLDKSDIFSALSTGCIMSAAMYLSSSDESITYIIDSLYRGVRFQAFASDPNAYSIYTCLALACAFNVNGRTIYKFCVMVLLIGLGLLTASKMGMLVLIAELFLFFIQVFNNSKEGKANKRFILFSGWGLTAIAIYAKDYLKIVLNTFIKRLGGERFDAATITTGRSTIFLNYVEILLDNPLCLFLGYGFNYHLYLGEETGHVAHNTYLDLILTWGVIGSLLFLGVMYFWISTFKTTRRIKRITAMQSIPTLVLLATFLSISCLSAGMFPFVLAVAMIEWLPETKKREFEESSRNNEIQCACPRL